LCRVSASEKSDFDSIIARIHLTPAEHGRIWGPGTEHGNLRSMIPNDYPCW
jgi:hypothetical protein